MENTSLNQPFVHASTSSVMPKTSSVHPSTSSVSLLTKLPKSQSSDYSWRTLHQQFTEYGRNAKEWTRKCILLLPQIEKQQIWRKKRFKDIYEYAAKLAGMSRYQVNEGLRALKKTENLPEIRKVIEEKGINAVRPILAIVDQETATFWAEKSRIMSQHALEVYVKNFKSEFGLRAPSAQSVNLQTLPFEPVTTSTYKGPQNLSFDPQGLLLESQFVSTSPSTDNDGAPKITLILQLDPKIADQFQKIKGQSDWNETIDELLQLRREKLEQTKPEVVENASRPISAAIENYVLAKTNSTCAFPGCYKPYEILHHTDRFAMYHIHDPDKIFPLCEAHERLAHLGLIENEDLEPKCWKTRTQPDYDDPKYEIDQLVSKFR